MGKYARDQPDQRFSRSEISDSSDVEARRRFADFHFLVCGLHGRLSANGRLRRQQGRYDRPDQGARRRIRSTKYSGKCAVAGRHRYADGPNVRQDPGSDRICQKPSRAQTTGAAGGNRKLCALPGVGFVELHDRHGAARRWRRINQPDLKQARERSMKVSYSSVFNQTADQVWAVIRDFNSYPVWVATVTERHIEGGKGGDSIG